MSEGEEREHSKKRGSSEKRRKMKKKITHESVKSGI